MSTKLQQALISLLDRSEAHASLEDLLANIPKRLRNTSVEGLPYTLWGLLEHIRLAQKDILDYMVDPDYTPGAFPEDYWPRPGARMHWDRTVKGYFSDLKKIKKVVGQQDPLAPVPYGEKGHTYLREVFILVDHLAYHLGQMMVILRLHGQISDQGGS